MAIDPNRNSRIDWVHRSCRLLAAIRDEFEVTQPFAGLTIGTGIHLEPKTVALLLTLRVGGARIVATGNLNSTQATTVNFLQANDINVFAEATMDSDVHGQSLARILAEKPDLLLDNGGDLFVRYLDSPYEGLLGGTEETTSGRARLKPLRDQLGVPILVINDSPIKQFAENKHAVGQSIFESYMRLTNRATNGKRVTVFGYGACGQGVAGCFRAAFSTVSVVDTNPVTTLSAHFDGFATPLRRDAIKSADIIVTETGAENIITADDIPNLKDGVILMNGGHFPTEIDVAEIKASPLVVRCTAYPEEGIESLTLIDERVLHILGGGHMVNLSGPRPLGNSIESMDIGFALQARCLERVAQRKGQGAGGGTGDCVVPVPIDIDARVAEDYLALNR